MAHIRSLNEEMDKITILDTADTEDSYIVDYNGAKYYAMFDESDYGYYVNDSKKIPNQIIENMKIKNSTLQYLNYKHEWFMKGASLEKLATIIWVCSHGFEEQEILEILKKECENND